MKLTEELECEEMNADVGRGVDQTVVAVPQLRRVTRDLRVLNNLDIGSSPYLVLYVQEVVTRLKILNRTIQPIEFI